MKKILKAFLLVILVLALTIGGFNIVNNARAKKAENERAKERTDKYLRLKVNIMEANKDEYTVSNMFPDHIDDFITFTDNYMILKKEGDYYTANVKQNVNKKVFDNINSYVFAKNNYNGEALNDCKYDEKTGKIKIPASYYPSGIKKDRIVAPVQIQFLSRMTKKELNDLPISVTTKSIFSKTKTYYRNGILTDINFTISKKLKKSDLKIYINGYKNKIADGNFEYDSKTGKVSLKYSPTDITKIEIREENIISKIIGSNKVYAYLGSGDFIGPKTNKKVPNFEIEMPPSIPSKGRFRSNVYGYNYTAKQTNDYWHEGDKVYRTPTLPAGNVTIDWSKTINIKESNFGDNQVDYVVGVPIKDLGFDITGDVWFGSEKVVSSSVSKKKEPYFYHANKTVYLYATCVHIENAIGGTLLPWPDRQTDVTFYFKKIGKTSSNGWTTVTYIAIQDPDISYIGGTDDSSQHQSLSTIFKVCYEDAKGEIAVKKKVEGSNQKGGFTFALFSDSSCSNELTDYGRIRTDDTGYASWGENTIKLGKYYIKEVELNTTQWENKTGCTKIELTKNTKKNGKYYVLKDNYTNRRKYYASKIYKYSNDSTCSGYVNGAKFTLYYGSGDNPPAEKGAGGTGTLDAYTGGDAVIVNNGFNDNRNQWYGSCAKENGMAIFAMLGGPANGDNKFKVKETSLEPYNGTVLCGNTTKSLKMWNTGSSFFPSDGSIATVTMDYKDGKYYCPTSGFTGQNAIPDKNKKGDKPVNYCFRVVKVDSTTNKKITADTATFKTTIGGKEVIANTESGVATFFAGINSGKFTVQETKAPAGYALNNTPFTVDAAQLPETAEQSADGCKLAFPAPSDPVTAANGTGWVRVSDSRMFLNWFKVSKDNNNEMLNGAKFKVKDSNGKFIKVKAAKETAKAANGTTKSCYVYDTPDTTGSELVSGDTLTNGNTHTNGEVCISGVPTGTYTIIETSPAQYHAFAETTQITQSTSTNFYSKIVASTSSAQVNTFKNCDTEFELTKKVENDFTNDVNDRQYKQTTKELRKLVFNVYNGNTLIKFKKTADGKYEYASGIANQTRSADTVTDLQLDDNRKINIKSLPWQYTYKIKEKSATGCVDAYQKECESQGFYLIREADNPEWVINIKSSDCKTGSTGKVTREVTNTVTELNFTKKDIYSYLDGNTNSEVESKFESDEEFKLFDTIDFVFKIKNNGVDQRLKLEKVKDVGTCNLTNANNKSAYALYRYVIDDGQPNQEEVIHTYCGNIKIKHLCRDRDYYIEEISVPNNSVFILPEEHPEVKFTVGSTKDTFTRDSETHVIENTPTRVVFQKRDLKYGNIIAEDVGQEKTTFNVYRCNEGIDADQCTPTTGTLIKFHKREVIKNKQDNEDYGKEIYRYPESQNGSNLTSDLHPYKGDLILRYLPGGEFKTNENNERTYVAYNYIIVETQAPKGYDTPTDGHEITRFTVNTSTVGVDVVNIANKPTKLILRKYDQATGLLITGAKFRIYKVNNYDQNRSLKNQDKELLKLKTIRDGSYEYRDNKDTNVITTCIKDCASITETLVHDDFKTTGIGEQELQTSIQEGEAIVQYLDAESYYLIEEVSPKAGYELPNDEDRFVLVYIPKTSGVTDASVELYNTETVYQFYKFDEYNNLLDGAEFKLQKLDSERKYRDVKVVLDEDRTASTENANVYRIAGEDEEGVTITTKNGSAMIYRITEGQYRIVEVKAPEGKELPKKTINVATFFVDKDGHVYGSAIITNKSRTETTIYNPTAHAELIVNIQTGQNRIKYGIIIATIILAVGALIYFQNKKK